MSGKTSGTKAKGGSTTTMPMTAESREALEKAAYKKWEDAGCPPCDGVEYWLAAEREMTGSSVTITEMPTE